MKKISFSLVLAAGVSVAALSFATAQTLVTVNGEGITEDMLKKNIEQIPAVLVKGREGELRKTMLDRLVEQALIRQEAERLNVATDKEFKEHLKLMTNTLTYNFVIKKKLDEAITDDLLRSEYKKNLDVIARPAVKARHILVETEEAARDIIKQLKDGEDFAEVAEKKSIGPSGKNGGDLGWFYENEMVKPFSDAAFAMNAGVVGNDPVKTQFGWHVIKVEEKDDKHAPAFDAVEDELRKAISERTVAEYISQLKENADIKYTQ